MAHENRLSGAPAQRGQALVLGLVLLLAGCLGLFFLFSTGQVLSTRQRLDNAADAAAYSAALWRARVMNYHAYSNRAIVAQEVAIAQAVTLSSWARYFENFSRNAATLSEPFPPVASVLQAAASVASVSESLVREAAAEEITARDAYKRLLADSQEVLQASVGTFGLGAVAAEVARANDPAFFAFALPDGGAFERMTRRYDGSDRARLKDVVLSSLDTFTKGPRGTDITLYPLPSACFGNPLAGVDTWFAEIHKRGGTVMSPEFEAWEAADTLSLHNWWPKSSWFGGFRGCARSEWVPVGWGASQSASELSTAGALDAGGLDSNPGDVHFNPMATQLAEQDIVGGASGLGSYSGIAAVRELDYSDTGVATQPKSDIAVLARVDRTDVRTANVLNIGTGRLRLTENYSGGRMWALSAAQVYFRRPAGDAARVELASLYNPYWQVRLVEPSLAQRAAAESYAH